MTNQHLVTPAQPHTASSSSPLRFEIDQYIAWLASPGWDQRHAAERGLAEFGPAAVPALVRALSSDSDRVRWGAAKVLCEIGWPSAAPALVASLEDSEPGVRWLAAQSLVALGDVAVIPLLRRLILRASSPWMQDGAHRVLRGLANPALDPVLEALDGHFPAFAAPVAANDTLRRLEGIPAPA